MFDRKDRPYGVAVIHGVFCGCVSLLRRRSQPAAVSSVASRGGIITNIPLPQRQDRARAHIFPRKSPCTRK